MHRLVYFGAINPNLAGRHFLKKTLAIKREQEASMSNGLTDSAATPAASAGRTGASAAAIMSHYDRGDEFFSLVLDPEMVYSAALFEDGDDLARAQLRKLDHHIKSANASNVARVLDIGCGWGAMLRRLVGHAGVKSATGLTLSPSQARWIRDHSMPGIEVLEEDWRDHKPAQRYDAIVSIGAFEHFVHKGIDAARKLDAYREFFAFCDSVLVPNGRVSLQTIAYSEPFSTPPLIDRTFPDSDLPLTWEPIAAAQGRFELMELRNDRDHYYRTLRLWEKNLLDNRARAVDLVGEAAVVEFQKYLRTSAGGFKTAITSLLRMSFLKKH